MMTKKYITLIGIIVILTAVWVLLYAFKDKGYTLPKFKEIKEDITKIEIGKKDNVMTLIKQESGKWIIEDNNYIVGKTFIDDMLDTLQSIKIKDFVSRGESNALAQYALDDDKKISVRAYGKDGSLLRDIFIGDKASSLEYVYGMKDNDKNIYLMSGKRNLKDTFDKTKDEMRNTTVVSILTHNLAEFTITEKDKKYTLTGEERETDGKKTAVWKALWKNGAYANEEMMKSNLYYLTYIGADGFSDKRFNIDDGYEYKIDYLQKDGKTVSLYILGKDENGNYSMAAGDDDTIYVINKEAYDKVAAAVKIIIGA